MAITYTCDGCGATVENPAKVGKVTQREYCPTCAERAEAFIVAEEALRKRTQAEFIEKRAELIESYRGMKLPDVP